ncbi:MAG: glycerol-3-phosphate transporter [Polyangiales bacterium]
MRPAGRRLVAGTLLAGYASLYLCRSNFDAAVPLWIVDFGWTKTRLGAVASTSVLAYAIGKLVLGVVGDAIGGKRVLLLAMGGSVLFTALIGLTLGRGALVGGAAIVGLTVLASGNRFVQAGGWGGVVHVVSRWFPPRRHGTVMGALSTSYELGNLLTLLLCGALVRLGHGWRALYLFNPALLALFAIGLGLTLRGAPPPGPPGAVGAEHGPAAPRVPLREALRFLARKPSFWVAVGLSMLLTFVRTGFMTWTPTYLVELARAAGQGSTSAAIVKSTAFPAAGIVGALVAGRISDRFGPGRRAPVMVVSLALLTVAVAVLAPGRIVDVRIAALSIAACGLFLLGPYSLLGGAITLDVAGTTAASTAAGIIDGVGYVGASLSGIVIGGVAQAYGWGRAFDVVAGATATATAVSALWAWRTRAAREPLV